MENNEQKTNLPPATLSVVIPAMPAVTAKSDPSDKIIEIGCVVVLALSALTWFSVESFDFRWMSMALFVVVMASFTYWATWRNRQTLLRHRDFESKLHEMAMQLAEKNTNLKQLVQIDPLTQLLNRRGLEKALTIEMSRCRRKGTKLYAILLDCDDFKSVNEHYGHAGGDLVLQEMAQNILRSIRPTDFASRVGGDEFIVLLIDIEHDNAARVAERIRSNINTYPAMQLNRPIPCTASLGVAQLPVEVCSIEEVLVLTRLALKASKKEGKNRITLAGASLKSLAQMSAEDEQDDVIEKITSGTRLRTVWQPIVRLRDRRVIAYEAFTRGPAGSFEMPGPLFKLANENSILTQVDMKCLKVALSHARKIPSDMAYHVNVFPSTLADLPLDALDQLFSAPPGVVLCVDISEQQFMGNPDVLAEHIEKLKANGVRIALDDVGYARSTSIESFIYLEPDYIKIHSAMIQGLAAEPDKQKHLTRLLALAGSIDAEVIAEGVEDSEDLAVLEDMGVPFAQGFSLAQPHEPPPEEMPVGAAEVAKVGD
jgi:diguanylate cyclase (GGDEF)-like protein